MHSFVVADRKSQGRTSVLCDSEGRFYVARATAGSLPPVGTPLIGNRPRMGFALLLGEAFNSVYRVTFEAVGCTHGEAIQSLHSSTTG